MDSLSTPGRAGPPFAGSLHVPHESSDDSTERIAAAVQRGVDARRAALRLDGSERSELDARERSELASR
jgi:hypothetical protein